MSEIKPCPEITQADRDAAKPILNWLYGKRTPPQGTSKFVFDILARHRSDACASVQKERDELREEVERLQIIKDREAALDAARAADPDYVHEGTIGGLAGVARMIEIWTPETFPVSELGQIHFGRVMLECAAGEIRAFLARYEGGR